MCVCVCVCSVFIVFGIVLHRGVSSPVKSVSARESVGIPFSLAGSELLNASDLLSPAATEPD